MKIKDYYTAPDQGLLTRNAVENAISRFNRDNIESNVDIIIHEAHQFAQEDFLSKEKTQGIKAIKSFLEKVQNKRSKNLTYENIGNHFQDFGEFYMSLFQARKTRAGRTFELIIKAVFDKLEIPYSFQSKNVDGRPDFIIPDENSYVENAQETIVLTAKRTVRERWRQITTEGTRGHRFYLATLDEDISQKSLDEMNLNHVSLILPKNIIDENITYQEHRNVYSFSDLVQRLIPHCQEYWSNL